MDNSKIESYLFVTKSKTSVIEEKCSEEKVFSTMRQQIISMLKDMDSTRKKNRIISFMEEIEPNIHKCSLLATALSNTIVLSKKKTIYVYLPQHSSSNQLHEVWNAIYNQKDCHFMIFYKGKEYGLYDYKQLLEIVASMISYCDDSEILDEIQATVEKHSKR